MMNLKVLSTAAALALLLPLAAAPTASFAQGHRGGGGGGGHMSAGHGGGMGGMRSGGGMGGGMRMGNAARVGGGGGGAQFRAMAQPARPMGGQQFTNSRGGTNFAAGPGRSGWNREGSGWNHRHHHGGFWPGVAAGAFVGGALASDYYGPYGYGDGYYDNGYYDDGGVAVVEAAPVEGDQSAYCAQRYRSYDPGSGTYLGYDGIRHPCP